MSKDPDRETDAILITGPTASGKSALAIELARRHEGVVINADSMQVYDKLRMLTARPSEAEMGHVRHMLYGHVPAQRHYSTGDWLREIEKQLAVLKREGRLPVIVGGTGLYFAALTGGLSEMPAIPTEIRERLRGRLAEEGAIALHTELSAKDLQAAATLRPEDGQRIVRALEVLQASGRSILEFQGKSGPKIVDPDRARKFVVLPERPLLHERINRRFGKMMDEGAIEEVEALLKLDLAPEMPVMKAIGAAQIALMLKGEMTREQVIEASSAATRQYAKRQMTWFRNQMDGSWQRIASAAEAS